MFVCVLDRYDVDALLAFSIKLHGVPVPLLQELHHELTARWTHVKVDHEEVD